MLDKSDKFNNFKRAEKPPRTRKGSWGRLSLLHFYLIFTFLLHASKTQKEHGFFFIIGLQQIIATTHTYTLSLSPSSPRSGPEVPINPKLALVQLISQFPLSLSIYITSNGCFSASQRGQPLQAHRCKLILPLSLLVDACFLEELNTTEHRSIYD